MGKRMKLRFRARELGERMGGVHFDGTIDLHPRLRAKPMILAFVFLHELAHWVFDAVGLHGRIHRWHDLVYTHVGLYDHEVNRAKMRDRIRSDEWESWRSRENKQRRR